MQACCTAGERGTQAAVLVQGSDISEELATCMGNMDKVLMAQGVVRQKRSRPLRAQLQLHCPKLALALEKYVPSTTSTSANGASSAGAELMVAAKELRCTVLAGSQESEQLQSGAGPLTVQVGCPSAHCTDGCLSWLWLLMHCLVVDVSVLQIASYLPCYI